MSECPACGNERTWEHEALSFACYDEEVEG